MSIPNDRKRLYELENGTVIDHIPAGMAVKVLQVLGFDQNPELILGIGTNFHSSKMGRKDVIKIENRDVTQDELNKIAVFAPTASVNRIQGGIVVSKARVEVPAEFQSLLECRNPNCITRFEKIETRFYAVEKNPLLLKCHHCEKNFEGKEAALLGR